MTSYTVTATQGGSTAPGMLLLVEVLNNAVMAGTPATGTSTTAYDCSVTTSQTGSYVFGALSCLNENTTLTAAAGTTLVQFGDATNSTTYSAFYTTSSTGSPGATTVGSSTAYDLWYACCAVEVIPSGGTLTLDVSSPAVADSGTLTALTTASFTPPAGTVLVAMVGCDGQSSGTMTMTVASSPVLTWTEQIKVNTAINGVDSYVGVWTAVIPGGGATSGPVLPPGPLPNRPVIIASNAGWRGAGHSR